MAEAEVPNALTPAQTTDVAVENVVMELPSRVPGDESESSKSDFEVGKISTFSLPRLKNRPNTIPGVASKSITQGDGTDNRGWGKSGGWGNYIALLLVISYIGVGTLVFYYIENWTVIECVYYAMVIVTTVGYGDVAPLTKAGRAFTLFYAFYGICTIGIALGRLASWFIERQEAVAKEATKRLMRSVDNAATHTVTYRGRSSCLQKETQVSVESPSKGKWPKWLRIVFSDSNMAIFYAVIPIFVSIGGGLIMGAIEGWPILDCFYYAVITVTTVGFGDLYPKSMAARIYAIFYLPLSVVSVAHSIGNIIEELNKRSVLKTQISMKELLAMDADGDGKVSRLEYLSYMLVKLNKADQDDIDDILAQFDKLDKDGSGELDHADLERLDRHLQRHQH